MTDYGLFFYQNIEFFNDFKPFTEISKSRKIELDFVV
jgi:hypothetical protein